MSGIEPFLLAAGTAISAVGAIQQGQSAAASARASADAATYQSQVQDNNARIERDQAAIRASEAVRRSRQRAAAARAASVQNGFEVSGSTADLIGLAEDDGALEALNATYEGELRARGQTASAELSRNRASSSRAAARGAATAGYLSAGTSVLTGANRIYKALG